MTEKGGVELRAALAGHAQAPVAISTLNQAADRRILIANACVISMDPDVGDYPKADVLIEGDTISRIGPNLLAEIGDENLAVLDASGMIVLPGFVDTHRHMWQAR